MTTELDEYNLDPAERAALDRAADAAVNFALARLEAGDSKEHLMHAMVMIGTGFGVPRPDLDRAFEIVLAALDAVSCTKRGEDRVLVAVPPGTTIH